MAARFVSAHVCMQRPAEGAGALRLLLAAIGTGYYFLASKIKRISPSDTEALKQVVECRRMLKWTYAYGFFLDDSEWARRNFFEFQQGEAEASLERLHEETETKLSDFIAVDTGGQAATTSTKDNTSKKKVSTSSDGGVATAATPANRDDERSFNAFKFDEFRCRLTSLTQVTRDYFSKLVAELASGNALSQVSPMHATMSRSAGATRGR